MIPTGTVCRWSSRVLNEMNIMTPDDKIYGLNDRVIVVVNGLDLWGKPGVRAKNLRTGHTETHFEWELQVAHE